MARPDGKWFHGDVMQTLESHDLTQPQIHQFHTEGWLGPFTLVPPDEMRRLDPLLDEQVFRTTGPNPKSNVQSRHMDVPLVYDLLTRPEILDPMASLYGPHLILWASYFFDKQPGGAEIPWHQDGNYWPLEPVVNISAWIAIDEVTVENSCVQLIPGSHKAVVPHIKSTEGMAFGEMADPAFFDQDQAVNIELQPGQFFLFNEKTLHHSEPNRSTKRRRGMTTRVTIPIVRINQEQPPLHPGHKAILVRGEDYMGFNQLQDPPVG